MPDSQWLWGAALALGVAGAAYRARALTAGGAAAWAVGAVVFAAGGWRAAAALLAFFGTSSALSRWRRGAKEALAFEKTGRRDAGQVWANGGVATLCLLLPLLHLTPQARGFGMFLAALAAAAADTWATEIGAALGGTPYLITTLRPAPPGTSGAVSAAGTGAALAGALLLGLFAAGQGVRAVGAVTAAGLCGSLFDSLLGATVQAQWRDTAGRWTERPQGDRLPARGWRVVNNDAVNWLCTALGAAVATALLP